MSWDDQGDDGDKGCNEQLQRPEVTLEEETDEGERRADNAAHRLGTETQDDTREETAKANANPLECAVEHLEDTSKPHRGPANTTDETDEDPHIENDLRIQRAVACAVIILAQEMNHQWRPHQRDAHPDSVTPVLLPQHQRSKLYKQEKCRRVSPDKKKVLARRYPVAINLATHSADDIEFGSSHKRPLLMVQI